MHPPIVTAAAQEQATNQRGTQCKKMPLGSMAQVQLLLDSNVVVAEFKCYKVRHALQLSSSAVRDPGCHVKREEGRSAIDSCL